MEIALSTICRMGGIHRFDDHCADSRIPCLPEGELVYLNLLCLIYWYSDLHCSYYCLEAGLSYKG